MPPLRPALKSLLFAAFLLALSASYFNRFRLPLFDSVLLDMGWTLLTILAAWGCGSTAARRILPEECTRAEQLIFGLALGWLVLSLGMMFLGVVQGWTPLVAKLGTGLAAGAGVWELIRRRKTTGELGLEMAWPVRIVGTLSVIMAFSPITYYDSLVYHMALPSAYIRSGHWQGWTSWVYSAFPQNMEMLWTLGLLIRNDRVSNLIGVSLAALLVLAVYAWGKRFLDQGSARVASILLAVMPAFLLLSSGGYVDIGLALYVFLSLYALSLWWPTQKPSLLVGAGLLAGGAMGIKYTGGLSIVIGALLIAYRSQRHSESRRRMGTSLALFGISAGLVFLPWALKNWHYFRNPVFPFLYNWGDPSLSPWPVDAAQGYFRMLVEYEPRPVWQLPKLLWDVVAHGFDFGGGMDMLGNLGWAPLIALLPAVGLAKTRDWPIRLLAASAALFFAAWGMSRPVLRFLMPMAPVFALLASYGWSKGVSQGPRIFRWGVKGLIGLLVISGGYLFCEANDTFQAFRVPLGLESRDSFLSRKLTHYAVAQFVNHHLDDSAHILVVGDQRSYYYERDVTAPIVFTQHPLMRLADAADSPQALHALLRSQWTHVIWNVPEMKRLAPYRAYEWTVKGKQNWEGLLKMLPAPIYTDSACEVLAL